MKKIIPIIMIITLLVGVLGGIVYAQESDTINAHFGISYNYGVEGNEFYDGDIEVTGQIGCGTNFQNGYGVDATSVNLTLDTELEFDWIGPEPDPMGPPTYYWDFDTVAPGLNVNADVGSCGDVSFIPGFNAERSANDYFELPGTYTQTLTIYVTPLEQLPNLGIDVNVRWDENVHATIQSATIDPAADNIWNNEQNLHIQIENPIFEEEPTEPTYECEVTIEVVTIVAEVEFMPDVGIGWGEGNGSGSASGTSSLAYTIVDENPDPDVELGTWTWSTAGTPDWQWDESINRQVHFQGYSESEQPQPGNNVQLHFGTNYNYTSPNETFYNHEVPGFHQWGTHIWNHLGNPEEVIDNATVSLNSGVAFNHNQIARDNLDFEDPPIYQWSFSDISMEDDTYTYVSFGSEDEPTPVPFTPGFNASRTLDVTRFDEPGYQNLTITVTPQELIYPAFGIGVRMPENTSIVAYIESCDATTDHNISEDGQVLSIWEHEVITGVTYTYEIRIRVEPDAHPVEIRPFVEVSTTLSEVSPTDIGETSSYSHLIGDMPGIWTWNLYSEYPVSVGENVHGCIRWEPYFEELINQSIVLFQTFWTHVPLGNEFENAGDVPGDISHSTQILNNPDVTGEPLANAVIGLSTEQGFEQVIPPVLGPPYQWSYGDIPEWEVCGASVRMLTDSVEFTPGFDVSHSVNEKLFSQPGIQTLDIHITPRDDVVDMVIIDVFAMEDDNVIPTILSVEGADDVFMNQDGHRLMIVKGTPIIDTEYTVTVTIEITPKMPQVMYKPAVRVYDPGFTSSEPSLEFGSSFTHEMQGVGTWTCSADGGYQDYQWTWLEGTARAVVFPRDSAVIITEFKITHMSVEFNSQPNEDEMAAEGTILLGEVASYDFSVDAVMVTIDDVEIFIPASSFEKQGNKECYQFKSNDGVGPKIKLEIDFENNEWELTVENIDASGIDNSDGVDVILTIGSLMAMENIQMKLGGLTYIAD